MERGHDFLLTEHASLPGYASLAAARGFVGVRLPAGGPLRALLRGEAPLELATEPRVYILERQR